MVSPSQSVGRVLAQSVDSDLKLSPVLEAETWPGQVPALAWDGYAHTPWLAEGCSQIHLKHIK